MTTPQEYFDALPEDRRPHMEALRAAIRENLPEGFSETISYGMVCYAVPHSLYPKGYHCNPQQPLPFISIASQKNFIALYHMGIYASPEMLEWFTSQYAARVKGKLDMGKSCVRFKKPENMPLDLIGELAQKMTPQEWISLYESSFVRK